MVEQQLKIATIAMMVIASIYAFDLYYDAGGVTGLVVNPLIDYSCTDTDNNNPRSSGITISQLYENGYAEDECVGVDLLEFYCSNKGPDVRIVTCNSGCFAGACN